MKRSCPNSLDTTAFKAMSPGEKGRGPAVEKIVGFLLLWGVSVELIGVGLGAVSSAGCTKQGASRVFGWYVEAPRWFRDAHPGLRGQDCAAAIVGQESGSCQWK
jgi:hypothetical protein